MESGDLLPGGAEEMRLSRMRGSGAREGTSRIWENTDGSKGGKTSVMMNRSGRVGMRSGLAERKGKKSKIKEETDREKASISQLIDALSVGGASSHNSTGKRQRQIRW